jgi:hypothetical protein
VQKLEEEIERKLIKIPKQLIQVLQFQNQLENRSASTNVFQIFPPEQKLVSF